MKTNNKFEFLEGNWEKEIPMFCFDNGNGTVKFKKRTSKINIEKKIIKFNKEDLRISLPRNPHFIGLKCPGCEKKTFLGYWNNYLPLLEDKNLKQVVVVSEMITKNLNNVSFCSDCGIFINPQKEFEIFAGGKKEAKEGVNNNILASITYTKYLKNGAIIGGLIFLIIILGFFLFSIFTHKISKDVPLLFVLPLCIFLGFLVGTPFGALFGVIIGRKVNKAHNRPPF